MVLLLESSDSTSFEGVAPSFLLSFSILKVMPGSHLLSRSLAPQYYRPAVSLPSCSGWERVFLTAASPPDNYFLEYYFISDLLFLDQLNSSNQQRVNTQTPTSFLRKEVIQPHLPIRLPCYDFTPVTDPAVDCSLY